MAKGAKTNKKSKHLLIILLGMVIAYLPSYIHKIMNWTGVEIGPDGPPSVLIWNWLAVALLLGYIVYVERKKLASILLVKPNGKDVEWAFWFWGLATITSWLATKLFPPDANQGTNELLSYSALVISELL